MKKFVKPILAAVGILIPGTILLAVEIGRFGGMFRSFASGFPAKRGKSYLSVLVRASLARLEPVAALFDRKVLNCKTTP